jgi:hypothetical protein
MQRSRDGFPFSQRRVPAVLVIPPEFDMAHLLQGPLQVELRQQPNNTDALAAYQAITKEVDRAGSLPGIAAASVAAAEKVRPFAAAADRQAYFDAALAEALTQQSQAPDRLTVTRGATVDQIQYDSRANSSAGQLITWVFVPLLGISGMFAAERRRGTLRRLLSTPTGSATYPLGTIGEQVGTALVQMLLVGLMRLNWGQDPAALALILLATALAGAALGTMLGAFVRSEGQAGGLSWMLGMLMALLGGCWYPAEPIHSGRTRFEAGVVTAGSGLTSATRRSSIRADAEPLQKLQQLMDPRKIDAPAALDVLDAAAPARVRPRPFPPEAHHEGRDCRRRSGQLAHGWMVHLLLRLGGPGAGVTALPLQAKAAASRAPPHPSSRPPGGPPGPAVSPVSPAPVEAVRVVDALLRLGQRPVEVELAGDVRPGGSPVDSRAAVAREPSSAQVSVYPVATAEHGLWPVRCHPESGRT